MKSLVERSGFYLAYMGHQSILLYMKLTDKDLIRLCNEGRTDQAIGNQYGMTGEGVGYRRRKLGIAPVDKNNSHNRAWSFLRAQDRSTLEKDYYHLTTEQFSEKYQLSKTAWLPYIRRLGIKSKNEHRIDSYPDITKEQIRLIIGGLLGDGGIDESGRYHEFHSFKQEQYLRKKCSILKPFSFDVREEKDGTGLCFSTVNHPIFLKFRKLFYREGIDGKFIPVEYIRLHWDDSILVYWFFDDGYFDDEFYSFTISNKCPDYNQLVQLKDFLEDIYHWNFYCTPGTDIYRLSFSNKYNDIFGKILLKYATPDLFYKIPEELLGNEHIRLIDINGASSIKPKFYRSTDDGAIKLQMEDEIFNHYRKTGFPYVQLTEDRLSYLYDSYKGVSIACVNDTLQHNTSGLQLCECFFPNMYECKRKGFDKSPVELWEDDNFLRSFVRNRLRYANRITDASMRTGIKLSKICVSNFKPAVADFIYKKYAVNKNVLDYSCGFGSRMLAAMSLGLNYFGFEPATKTHESLIRMGNFLSYRTSSTFSISLSGSEQSIIKENFFGLAFSSPPYYDFERYSDDSDQSIIRYPNYDDWIHGFWKKVMENCYRSLIPEGYFGVCLSPKIATGLIEYTFKFASDIGFYFEKDYRVLFRHVLGGGDKVELILMFSKKGPGKSPRFVQNKRYACEVYSDESVFMESMDTHRRKFYLESDYEKAQMLFKAHAEKIGVSREAYADSSLLGIPNHCLEYRYGGWNNFIVACGLTPQYKAETPIEIVTEYFNECQIQNRILSFYEYGKIKGNNYTQKMKRLFNSGKRFNQLRDRLFKIVLNKNEHEEFLKNF